MVELSSREGQPGEGIGKPRPRAPRHRKKAHMTRRQDGDKTRPEMLFLEVGLQGHVENFALCLRSRRKLLKCLEQKPLITQHVT